jgi:uncharacterized protein YutE (UPF0331/DUF86 family)/predicted nucleotidyltransferase
MADRNNQEETRLLKEYFAQKDDVLMAFVFGSYARGQEMAESDFDVAVYFKAEKGAMEHKCDLDIEGQIWSDVSAIVKKEVDLVCLNNAPASLVSSVITEGIPLVNKDKKLFWEIYLKSSSEAEDFYHFVRDFYDISKNSKSLTEEQETKLLERLLFLKSELHEIDELKKLTFESYQNNKIQRRNIERWAENIINATIDISKIVLASEKKLISRTYEQALRDFGIFSGLNLDEAKKLAKFAELRNILAHEYLEILYTRITNFIDKSPPFYKRILDFLEDYLKKD